MEPMRLLVTDAAAQPPRQATAWLIMTLGRKSMKTLKIALIVFGVYFMLLPARDILNQGTRPYRIDLLEHHLRSLSESTPEARNSKDWIRSGFASFTNRQNATLNEHFVSAALGFCMFCAGIYLVRWNPNPNRNEK